MQIIISYPMTTLLITGAGPNGITGRLIKEFFINKYNLLTPSSAELDLRNDGEVSEYFSNHSIDFVIHCATYRKQNTSIHDDKDELENNLRMYYALASQSSKFEKMIYFGSGAEYDKSRSIIKITEEQFGRSIPKNQYGLGKYIMNCHAKDSSNIYNFRLFGTINKYERFTKNVISNLCVKAIKGVPLELRQDCRFSFIDINDILPILEHSLINDLKHHDYNITMADSYLLSEIAAIIRKLTNTNEPVKFRNKGLNLEYTASSDRFIKEFNPRITPIEQSIKKVIEYYDQIKNSLNINNINSRWS